MNQKVVIIGTGYTSRLGVIRSVAQMGCDISVVVMTSFFAGGRILNKLRPIDCYSKYVNHVYYCAVRDDEGLIQILLKECVDPKQKVVLIPDSDFSAAVIDQNQKRLRNYFLFPHIHHCQGEVTKWMNKGLQKEMAASVGLTVPESHIIRIINKEYVIPESIQYPCFCKPLHSIHGGKRLFKHCENKTELTRAFEYIVNIDPDIDILVEKYINIEKEYAVLGFSDGTDVIIPGVVFLSQISKSHPGVALCGEILPVCNFEGLISKFQNLVRKIGFVGLFDIDFYYSRGTYYFGELNLRFGGSGYAITKMGVNLPAMFVKTLLGKPVEDMNKTVAHQASYANEKMCMDDWYKGYLTTEQYHQILESVNHTFVKDPQDPQPELQLAKRYKMKTFMRKVKRFLK